jgi:hypothetical protein
MLAGSFLSICSFLVLSIILMILPFSVQGQIFCLERPVFAAHLLKEFQERPIAIGISNDKTKIIEIFASSQGETFTIVFTTEQGLTCSVIAGKKWLNLAHNLNPISRIVR